MLSNPEVLRQSMEIASNPSLLQEMMRSYDRAVLNLESIPGGSGHLQRIYESVQEPMLNAMQGGDANNPFADLAGRLFRTSNFTFCDLWNELKTIRAINQVQGDEVCASSMLLHCLIVNVVAFLVFSYTLLILLFLLAMLL